ncbi:MAG TPA: DnaJ C-terminal domain-containing protein [bacterium]|nr:DnaJ C-terminal domain-containing protein [bacterium]
MEFKDYYKILEVERTADQKAISQAFRKLARRHHPDVNPGDKQAEARFKEVNEAYQVLNDPERRAKYDQLLDLRQRGGGWEDLLRRGAGQPGDGAYTVYGSPEDLGPFSDFFRQLFGEFGGGAFAEHLARGSQRRARRGGATGEDFVGRRGEGPGPEGAGQDVQGTIEITLEDAYHGSTRTVTIPAGAGRQRRSIEVAIPKGVRSGQRIRVAGQGQGGDLYLTVQIAPHPIFTRQDDDVLCEVAVPVWTAALGGTIEAPTLGGRVTVTIPAGTRDGRTFRLRGQGLPHLRGAGAGDELVKVRLSLPESLSARDRELFEEMRRLHEVPSNS